MKWGKSPTNKCKHCGAQETTLHILNGCKIYLTQGRYTWRHDNILHYIGECLDKSKFEASLDIESMQYQTNKTVPPKLNITSDRPYIVIIDN